MKTLTFTESSELKKHEATITTTRGAFVACGKALEAIRDGKLYRAKFGTFEEYCQNKWGWTRQRAYQLIEAAGVAESVKNVNHGLQTERQARALADVPEPKRAEVLKKASENGPATADKIKKLAKELDEKKSDTVIELDETGFPVRGPAIEFWNRSPEARAILRMISGARAAVRDVKPDDKMYSEVNVSAVLASLNNAYTEFSQAIPYAVCTTCQGQTPDTCTFCKGRGVISKFRYDTCTPAEIKTIRKSKKK